MIAVEMREQHGVDRRAISEEHGEMARDCRVGRVRKAQFPEAELGAPDTRVGVALGEKSLEQQAVYLCPCDPRRARLGDQARSPAGNRDGERFVGGTLAGQGQLLDLPAPCDEMVPR